MLHSLRMLADRAIFAAVLLIGVLLGKVALASRSRALHIRWVLVQQSKWKGRRNKRCHRIRLLTMHNANLQGHTCCAGYLQQYHTGQVTLTPGLC